MATTASHDGSWNLLHVTVLSFEVFRAAPSQGSVRTGSDWISRVPVKHRPATTETSKAEL